MAANEQESRLAPVYQDEYSAYKDDYQSIIYAISHDLNAPLANARGLLMELKQIEEDIAWVPNYLAKDMPDDLRKQAVLSIKNDFPEVLSYLESSMEKMSRMFKLLVAHSRLHTREMEPRLVDVGEVLNQCIQKLAENINHAKASITFEGLGHCWFDELFLEQVFDILLDNALQYRATDRLCQIEIRQNSDEFWTLIEVIDNGVGIEPSDQEKIFAPFKRLENRDSDGMGLATARTIVHRHSGRISCESRPGYGSAFLIHLPFVPSDER